MFDMRQSGLPKVVRDSQGKEWVAIYNVRYEIEKRRIWYICVESDSSVATGAPCFLVVVPDGTMPPATPSEPSGV